MNQIIIGALLGILGSLAGISFQTRLSWRQDRKTRKLEKLEELLSLASACVFGSLQKPCQKEEFKAMELHKLPETRIRVIACLYFPELKPSVATLTALTMLQAAGNTLRCDKLKGDEVADSTEKERDDLENRIVQAHGNLETEAEALCRRIEAS